MTSDNGKKLYWLIIASGIIMLLPNNLRESLYLNFKYVLDGQIWRVISGHLTHLSWTHWLFNMAGLLLLQRLYGKYFAHWHQLVALLAFIMIAVSLGLLIFSEELKWYGGLSGVAIGLFYFAAIKDYPRQKIFNALALATMSLYILLQQFSGERIEGLVDGISVAARAHLFGAIAGLLWLLLLQLWNKAQQKI